MENGESLLGNFNGLLIKNEIVVNTNEPIKEIVLDPEKKYPLINNRNWTVTN